MIDNKRGEIYIFLLSVEKAIPTENENSRVIIENLKDSLGHAAPEILDLFWKKIFNHLSTHFNDSLDWHEKICDMYNEAYKTYVEKYKNN